MFNFFKKKDKESGASVAEEDVAWGVPTKRKMSRKEAEAEAAEQALVESKNKERRDMYRIAGTERIFNDNIGRRLALRAEDNSGPNAVANHPAFQILCFWGARELARIKADMQNGSFKLLDCHTENGYEGWGIPAELLGEAEKLARSQGAREICTIAPGGEKDWDSALFTQSGYQLRGAEVVKTL